MEFVKIIPALLSLSSTLIVCIVSMLRPIRFGDLCLRASMVLVIFYLIGLMISKMLTDIIVDVMYQKKKKIEERRRELEEQLRAKEREVQGMEEDEDEEFSPLPLEKLENTHATVTSDFE